MPLYRGSAKSLLGELIHAKDYHGNDGFGDYFSDPPPSSEHVKPEHAVHALTRLVNEHPGEITLVALAPLTNIALTHRLDPEFGNKLKEIVIMGGNISGMGNASVSGEFNFLVDPESASIVLNKLACPKRIVSLEACIDGGIECEWFKSLLDTNTTRSQFIGHIEKHPLCHRPESNGKYVLCDPLAMLVAIDESATLESKEYYCTVELTGTYTRGEMLVDWHHKFFEDKQPNVRVVTKTDVNVFKYYLLNMFK